MYEPTAKDNVWEIPVWGRFGNTKDRLVIAKIFRHTEIEARAYVVGLGYEIVELR